MGIIIKKKWKGHDIFIDNEWVMWVTGSRKNAEREIKKAGYEYK